MQSHLLYSEMFSRPLVPDRGSNTKTTGDIIHNWFTFVEDVSGNVKYILKVYLAYGPMTLY